MSTLSRTETDIHLAMLADRQRLRRQWRAIQADGQAGGDVAQRLVRWSAELERSIQRRAARCRAVPDLRFDPDLPIAQHRDEIAEAIRRYPVVIVSGETGSGKSTQLPKICLQVGRGTDGMIGHTQPRRIAARSIATRLAEELRCPLGREVGFKVRFTDESSPDTLVKLMTDGVLLAETQHDRFLDQYDTIILDEAHERSLNIDFLIGYLKRLLLRRRDLKLIVTSATIDAHRFARHFHYQGRPAPVFEVSGRAYPVEMRYRQVEPDDESPDPDWLRGTVAAVEELAAEGPGDVLVFMSTERDIHEAAKALRGVKLPGGGTEILPLYARLSTADQQRVFQPHRGRRIVIATNVAESSLTVPGIRYVVDTGTARISRYSARSKTQRLPIEAVSQASADQRAGRCGRVGPGVCVRLYSEEDYKGRDRFTPPEILRTNLASAILQTKALDLGAIEDFPFIDPPRRETIRDGYATLYELGAIDENHALTDIGRKLSRLPVDPRIGRMILAAEGEKCLPEILVIAAVLEIQDPRERPSEKAEAADAAHARFAHEESDFLTYLKLWDFYHEIRAKVSRSQLQKACRQNFLSYNRMREWLDIHRQLLELAGQVGLRPGKRLNEYDAIHRAILAGLLSNVAQAAENHEYRVAGGGKFRIWPGSAAFSKRPRWIVAAELVETTKRWLRVCARISPKWIEPAARHLVTRTHDHFYWDPAQGSAMAYEKVDLMSLTIVPKRRVRLGPIDPEEAREQLIWKGLVNGQLLTSADFFNHNHDQVKEAANLEAKLRRHDLLRGQSAQYDFYNSRLPADVIDARHLEKWRHMAEQRDPNVLFMQPADLLREDVDQSLTEQFPDVLRVGQTDLPLHYTFEPGTDHDGVTLEVPLEALNQLDSQRIGWAVPGLFEQKVTALIRALPKHLRVPLVPAPDTARKVLGMVAFGRGDVLAAVAGALSRLAGQPIRPSDFDLDRLPGDLVMNIRVVDAQGQPLLVGRDLADIRRRLGAEAAQQFAALDEPEWTRDGLTRWDFDALPERVELRRGAATLHAFPMLLDRGENVALRLTDSAERARSESRRGVRRLFVLATQRSLREQVQWLPGLKRMRLYAGSIRQFDLDRDLSELIADRALGDQLAVPRDRAAFDRLLEEGRQRIGLAVQDVTNLVERLLAAYHEARLAAETAHGLHVQYAQADMEHQIDALVAPGFLVNTPWSWLLQYPRYFKGVVYRIDRLRSGAQTRDAQGMEQLAGRWAQYAQRAGEHAELGICDPQLIAYRFLLEEFRVSLFAEPLGTALPVSAKRLDQQWAKVRTLI